MSGTEHSGEAAPSADSDAPVPYYEDEWVTLYHGDANDVLPTLPTASVSLVVTDPPYFQPAKHYVSARGEARPRRSFGDTSILSHAFKGWAGELARIVQQTGTIYWFCDGQSYPITYMALYPHAKHVRPLIWDKVTSYNGYTWRHQHELIAWAEMPEAERTPTGDGDVLKCRAVKVGDRVHPAQKPQPLLETLVSKHESDGIVLDPFAGSGSSLMAARAIGRKSVGVEIDERYCEALADRLSKPETLFGGAA